jgi:hypothetical protein
MGWRGGRKKMGRNRLKGIKSQICRINICTDIIVLPSGFLLRK